MLVRVRSHVVTPGGVLVAQDALVTPLGRIPLEEVGASLGPLADILGP